MILLDAKTHSVPKFIGASLHNFESTDIGIELSVPLALDGLVNPSDTLGPSSKSLHHLRPLRIEESPRYSKSISRSIFWEWQLKSHGGYQWNVKYYRLVRLGSKITYLIFKISYLILIRHNDLVRCLLINLMPKNDEFFCRPLTIQIQYHKGYIGRRY